MVNRLARRKNLLRCPGLWLPVINQIPLSRSGPKQDSRKSRDIQSPSQRWCELKCADSRAVTKRGLFDCEPAHTADRMVQCDKTTCAQWTMNVKCNIQICFHLWQSVNENKCITAVRIPTKVIDENYGIHDVWEFRRKIKLLKRWCYRPLREFSSPYGNCIRSFRDLIVV